MTLNPLAHEASGAKSYVKRVRMHLRTPEEIEASSALKPHGVLTATLYEGGAPTIYGLLSPLMGPINDRDKCGLCGHRKGVCPGHEGHINLAAPVYNTEQIAELTSALNCFCPHCSTCLVDLQGDEDAKKIHSNMQMPEWTRLSAYAALCKKRTESGRPCPSPHCRKTPYIWTFVKPFVYYQPVACAAAADAPALAIDESGETDEKGKKKKRGKKKEKAIKATDPIRADPRMVLRILEPVPQDEYRELGFGPSRAESIVLRKLPVPSNTIRPPLIVSSDTSTTCENELTQLLLDVMAFNKETTAFELQGAVAKYLSGESAAGIALVERNKGSRSSGVGAKKRGGAAAAAAGGGGTSAKGGARGKDRYMSLVARSRGKEGRFRNNVLGGRRDLAARAVVTGDPWRHPCELGVPEKIARTCTQAERVFSLNRKRLSETVLAGPDGAPPKKRQRGGAEIDVTGAEQVHIGSDTTIILDPSGKSLASIPFEPDPVTGQRLLPNGVVVERHLKRGDEVGFNRQPTLHLASFVSKKAVPIAGNVFKGNPTEDKKYNRDYDGDEMNLTKPQGMLALAEHAVIMRTEATVVDPQDSSSLMGLTQWQILGIWSLTQRDTRISKAEMCDLITAADAEEADRGAEPGNVHPWKPIASLPPPAFVDASTGEEWWTGRQLISSLTPTCFVGISKEQLDALLSLPSASTDEEPLCIHAGEILSGCLTKKYVSTTEDSIVLLLNHLYGPEVAIEWLWKISRVALLWVDWKGHTITLEDLALPDDIRSVVEELQLRYMNEAERIIASALDAGVSIPEEDVLRQLRHARDESGVIVKKNLRPSSNGFAASIESGARGSHFNATQMIGSMGPQQIDNGLFDGGFSERSCPLVPRCAPSVRSRGFIPENIAHGLNPLGIVAQAATGRDGIINTAVKTSFSGQTQRELAYALSSVISEYDFSVRCGKQVLQRVYGGDGLDTQRLMPFDAGVAMRSDRFLREAMQGAPDEWISALLQNADGTRKFLVHRDRNSCKTTVHLGADIPQLVTFALHRNGEEDEGEKRKQPRLSATKLWQRLKELMSSLRSLTNGRVSTHLMEFALMWCLRPAVVSGVGASALNNLFSWIKRAYRLALLDGKKAVGLEAGTCQSRPLTQLTLNTHHFSGLESKHMSGVSGYNQVAHHKSREDQQKRKCAMHELVLVEPLASSAAAGGGGGAGIFARELAALVPEVLLNDLVEEAQVFWDPDRLLDAELAEEMEEIASVIVPDALMASARGASLSVSTRMNRVPLGSKNVYANLGIHSMLSQRELSTSAKRDASASASASASVSAEQDILNGGGGLWNPWVVRLRLCTAKCYAVMHTPETLARVLFERFGAAMEIVHSCAMDDEWILNIRLFLPANIKPPFLPRDLPPNATESDRLQHRNNDFRYHLAYRTLIILCFKTDVSGVEEIYNAQVADLRRLHQGAENGSTAKACLSIAAEGINPTGLVHWWPFDDRQVTCSDPPTTFKRHGLFGQRSFVPLQIGRMLSHAGSVHRRHTEVLSAQMNSRGDTCSISRNGVSRIMPTTLERAAFGNASETIRKAAICGKVDDVSGVMDGMITGGHLPLGTDTVQLFMDDSTPEGRETIRALSGLALSASIDPAPAPTYPHRGPKRENSRVEKRPARAQWHERTSSSSTSFSWHGKPEMPPPPSPQRPYHPPPPPPSGSWDIGHGEGASPKYSASSPLYSASSPLYSASSPKYSASSPLYSASSPKYSASSPGWRPQQQEQQEHAYGEYQYSPTQFGMAYSPPPPPPPPPPTEPYPDEYDPYQPTPASSSLSMNTAQ